MVICVNWVIWTQVPFPFFQRRCTRAQEKKYTMKMSQNSWPLSKCDFQQTLSETLHKNVTINLKISAEFQQKKKIIKSKYIAWIDTQTSFIKHKTQVSA